MRKKPRILMFALDCFPAVSPEAIVNAKLAIAMTEAGWEINVISKSNCRHRYPSSADKDWTPLADITQSIYAPSGWSAQNLLIKLRAAFQTGHITFGLSWVGQAISAGRRLASEKRYDVIISRATPWSSHLPALFLSRRLKVPWIANCNDPEPYEKYPPPYGQGPAALISPRIQKVFDAMARNASWITFPCERLRSYICSYLLQSENVLMKSSVIPHIAMRRFQKRFVKKHSRFILCHAGSVNSPRDSSTFLEGIKRFLQRSNDPGSLLVRFIGQQPDDLAAKAAAFGLNNVILIEEPKPYVETLEYLTDVDVLVIIEAPCEEGIFFPSKFVDYVQIGRPILAISPVEGTLADILSKHGGGIAVDVRSPQSIAEAIENLYNHWKAGTLETTYNSSRLFEMFSEEQILSQYMNVFARISDKTH